MSDEMGKVLEFKRKKAPTLTNRSDIIDYNTRIENIRRSVERINQLVADLRKDERFRSTTTNPDKDPPK